MQWEVKGMAEANPQISDTLPRRGRVNEGECYVDDTLFLIVNLLN